MRKKLVMLICVGIVVSLGLVSVSLVNADTLTGDVTVANAAPVIHSQSIEIGGAPVTTVAPFVTFFYNFTAYDADGVADIRDLKIELTYVYIYDDTPQHQYSANYSEDLSAWTLLNPTVAAVGEYLITGSCDRTVDDLYNISYSFAMKLNKTAQDSNSALKWYFIAYGTDWAAETGTNTMSFYIAPFAEIAVTGNNGPAGLLWSGPPQSIQPASFTTMITVNDAFELNASFTGAFVGGAGAWGTPTLTVMQNTEGVLTPVPDAMSPPGTNTTWYTYSFSDYERIDAHTMYLVFPTGIIKTDTYSGVNIFIQVKND